MCIPSYQMVTLIRKVVFSDQQGSVEIKFSNLLDNLIQVHVRMYVHVHAYKNYVHVDIYI